MSTTNKIILSILAAVIVSGLAGFYVGRYYERESFRKNFVSRQQNRGNGGGMFRDGERGGMGGGQREGEAGRGGGMMNSNNAGEKSGSTESAK